MLECAACDDAVRILREAGLQDAVMRRVTDKVAFYLSHRGAPMETGVMLFSKEYGILGQTDNVGSLIREAAGEEI